MMRLLMIGIVMILLSGSSPQVIIDENCLFMEFNEVYDDKGDLRLKQLIIWEWRNIAYHEKTVTGELMGLITFDKGYGVRDFLVIKKNRLWPVAAKQGKHYVCIFKKNDNWYRLRGKWVIFSKTDYDVEIRNRKVLNAEHRRVLYKP